MNAPSLIKKSPSKQANNHFFGFFSSWFYNLFFWMPVYIKNSYILTMEHWESGFRHKWQFIHCNAQTVWITFQFTVFMKMVLACESGSDLREWLRTLLWNLFAVRFLYVALTSVFTNTWHDIRRRWTSVCHITAVCIRTTSGSEL